MKPGIKNSIQDDQGRHVKPPSVSVVMPIHHAGKFMQSVDSVLSQEFGDFELIVVDGGAVDNSAKIINSYNDDRIKLFLCNSDYADSLNMGISQARGKYIALMDADGIMTGDRLRIQHEFMEKHPDIDISAGWAQIAGDSEPAEKVASEHNNIARLLIYGNVTEHATVMFKKERFKQKRLKYKPYLHAENYKMWTDMIKSGFRFAVIQQTFIIYEQRYDKLASHAETGKMHQAVTRARLEFVSYIMEMIVKKDERYLNLVNSLIEAVNNDMVSTEILFEFTENIYAKFLKADSLRSNHESIKKLLKKRYLYIIDQYRKAEAATSNRFSNEKTSPIWVCWWQGKENMPDTVKICFHSICGNAASHPVKLITRDNYMEYIELPCYILEKVNSGIITLTHLSDILRFSMLHKYGGYWIDATVLLTSTLRRRKNTDFFTAKTFPNLRYVTGGKWAIYLIGGGKQNLLFDFVITFLHEYWKKEHIQTDYFLTDYIVALAYDHIPGIKKMIDGNDCCMPAIYDMADMLNEPFDTARFDEICRNTCVHKLSWKRSYMQLTENGEPTLYGYLMERFKTDMAKGVAS